MAEHYLTDQDKATLNGVIDDVGNLTGGRTLQRRRQRGRQTFSDSISESQFFASQKDEDEVSINEGWLIRGSDRTTVSQEDITITAGGGEQTWYVYLESWYRDDDPDKGLKTQYDYSETEPTQGDINDGVGTYECERFLIATVLTNAGTIMEVRPEKIGEIHSARIWS